MKRKKLNIAISQIMGFSLLGISGVYAGDYYVTSTGDTHTDGLVTFREAVELSNQASGNIIFDEMVFSTPQIISLTQGEITIESDTNIDGTGADKVTIDGANSSRILTISDNDSNKLNVSISGMSFQNGNGTSTVENGNGGCILSNENLVLNDSIVTGCQSTNDGGGIFNQSGSLEINSSTISNNTAGNLGGSTASKDRLSYITNTTISGNTAGTSGGGMYLNEGGIILLSTITNNTSNDNSNAGIYAKGNSLILANSIIAGNNGSNDLEKEISNAYALVNNSVLGITGPNIMIGGTNNTNGVDPELSPLQNNGGTTPTHSISLSSPALNRGNDECYGTTIDQRGQLRDDFGCDSGSYERDGFANIEVDTVAFNTATDGFCSLPEAVHNANFDNNSFLDCAAGDGADSIGFSPDLNGQTITASNVLSLSSEITFDGPGGDQLFISGGNSTSIFNTTYSAVVTINGLSFTNGNGTGGGVINNQGHLTINNSLFRYNLAEYGGVISNFGSLFLNRVNMVENEAFTNAGAIHHSASATLLQIDKSNFMINKSGLGSVFGDGGAINIEGPSVNINQSTFYRNTSAFTGGALKHSHFTATITNSTFSQNAANSNGGAISSEVGYFGTDTNISQSTFSGNLISSGDGASINTSATLNINNSIIDGNGPPNNCVAVTINNNNNNLVEDGSCSFNAVNQLTGDPMLEPLTDVGDLTLAHMPMAGSPVIDNGSLLDCTIVDQRGFERPVDGDGNGTVECDIGSIEVENPDIIFKNSFEN